MNNYTKFGFTLGQILQLDGEDVLITGFKRENVQLSPIRISQNEIYTEQPHIHVENTLLQDLYEAYVSGFGCGGLSVSMPEKYKETNNPHAYLTRQSENWIYGFNNGQNNVRLKSALKESEKRKVKV